MADEKANNDEQAREPKLRKKKPEVEVIEQEMPEETPEPEAKDRVGIEGWESTKEGRVHVARKLPVDQPSIAAKTDEKATGEGAPEAATGQAEAADEPRLSGPAATAKVKEEADSQVTRISDEEVTTDDFAAMFEDAGAMPATRTVQVGDQVTGRIVAIGEKFVFVELGTNKTEGAVVREDYEDEEGNLEVAVGDDLELYVLSTRGGDIVLGSQLSGRDGAMEAIETAYSTGVPMQGTVKASNKGGFTVDLGGVEAFCPISQIELGYTENPAVHVGASYRFKVTEIREDGRSVVVSRAALIQEEREAKAAETLATLEEGLVTSGTVTRVTDFGAFVDIGGVEGLVHVSELAHSFFDKAEEVVKPGDTLQVKVLEITEDKRKDQLRISLSVKATQQDPWETVNERFAVGQQVDGEVVRLAPFGAFVEIAPGVDGLVHVSEMSWEKHVKHPRDVVSVGDTVRVAIEDIDVVRQRISLSMKSAEGDPWDTAAQRYAEGDEVTGLVENIEDFGVFVRLDSGITALLPRSEMDLPGSVPPHRKYTAGEDLTARVLSVDTDRRRMALTTKSASDIAKSDRKPSESKKSDEPTSHTDAGQSDSGGFGTLGDLLGDKLKG